MELGVRAPTSISGGVWGRPLWDHLMINPLRTVPVEALHADSLVCSRLPCCISLLLLLPANVGKCRTVCTKSNPVNIIVRSLKKTNRCCFVMGGGGHAGLVV